METTDTTIPCTACNDSAAPNQVTKTTDGKYVCLQCYRNTCSDLGKSTITGLEAKNTAKFIKGYAKQCNKYMLAVQAYAYKLNTSPRKAIQDFIQVESLLSEENARKDLFCTSEREHYAIMNLVLDKMGYKTLQKGDLLIKGDGNTRSDDGMLNTRAWYFRRRAQGRSLLMDKQYPIFPGRSTATEIAA